MYSKNTNSDMQSKAGGSNVAADVTNPFIGKTSTSPRKGSDADAIASLREGMPKMDIASMANNGDYSFSREKENGKEGAKGRDLDRFVPSRTSSTSQSADTSMTSAPTLALDHEGSGEKPTDASTTSLSASLGIPGTNRRILSFRSAPPPASHATSHLDQQRNYLLHSTSSASRGTTTTGPGATGLKKRAPPYIPDRILDAPGFADDYYLNLIDWGCSNRVAIGLGDLGYVWDAESGSVTALGEGSDAQIPVTSMSWSDDGSYLAIGNDIGDVEVWDVDEGTKMRTMKGHNARVPSLSWHGHVLSSGCRDGSIHHHDVRVSRHKVMELMGHTAEVCGLKWRSDGQLLASGGNDNVVNCWDGRIGQSVMQTGEGVPRGTAKWTKRNHVAAVKALAWCPWQSSLLATGGGSADLKIHFWSSTTGARTSSLCTDSQVTSLIWSPHSKEILSTHGFPNNNLSVWSYPSLEKNYDVPAHDSRVLSSTLSPDGTTVATGAGDENLKFWKIWEAKTGKKSSEETENGMGRNKNTVRIR